jgi:hypothetical protein
MRETTFARKCRLQREAREFARAMYGWNHPYNVEWAKSTGRIGRGSAGSSSLHDYCRLVESRLRAIEERQRVADVAPEPEAPVADKQPQADEPLVIRRRGEGGQPRAK